MEQTQINPVNNIIVFRDSGDGVLRFVFKNNTQTLSIHGDIFKIYDKEFNGSIINKTDYNIREINTQDGVRTFLIRYIIAVGGGRGGRSSSSGGIQGVTVKDNGVQVNGTINTLNFTGNGVTVTDGGGGSANIAIPGYVIASLTTAQRLALTPTTALIVEDTDLDMYFKWSTVSNAWSPF